MVTYANSGLKFYVDGVLKIDKTLSYGLDTSRNAIAIGVQLDSLGQPHSGGYYHYSGYINSVRIHGGVLTAAQVATNFGVGPAQAPAAPTVAVSGASALTTTTATLNANVNPQGSSTSVSFQWGLTTAYGATTNPQTISGGPQTISAPLTGLTNGAIYHFRVVATNTTATTTGPDILFRPAAFANAGLVQVDLRSSDATAGTATWLNNGALGSFTEVGNTLPTTNVASTGYGGVLFDGSTTSYNGPLSNDDLDAGSDRTLEAWVYNPSSGGEEAVIALGRRRNWQEGFALQVQPGTTYGALSDYGSSLGWATGPSTGAWHHVAAVYDGVRDLRVYLDGVLSNTKTLTSDYNTVIDMLTLGNQRNSTGGLSSQRLSGYINTVRVHGGALSPAQITTNYNLGPDLPRTGPTIASPAASFLQSDRVTLSASILPNGSAATAYIEYGLTTGYGSQSASQAIPGPLAAQTVTTVLTGLTTGALYNFRVVATNADGTTYGANQTFSPSPLAVAGQLYVDVRASNVTAGTGTWDNVGSLADFAEVGDTTTTTDVASTGIPGVLFDGTTTAYNGPIASPDFAGSSDRTIEFWAYNPSINNNYETVVNLGRQGVNRGLLAFGVGDSYGSVHWNDDINWNDVSPAADPTLGAWHHLTYVYTGGTTIKLFVDGVLTLTKTLGSPLATSSGYGVLLGATRAFAGGVIFDYGFAGYLNTVRIHGGALSDAQVVRNFQYGPAVIGVPDVVTLPASTVLDDRFQANGSVDPSGLATTAWIEYGPTVAYGSQTSATSVAATASSLTLTKVIAGPSGTLINYRMVAQNSSGISYGANMTATPNPLASAGTVYVDIRATQAGAGTATWPNLGTLGGNFSQIGTPSLSSNVAATNVAGVELNGTNNGYYGPTSPADITGSSDRTIEVWSYNPAVSNVEVMVDIGRYTGVTRSTYTACSDRMHFLTAEDVYFSGGAPTAGAWHHVVYVYDGATNVKSYVDGVLNTSATIGGVLATTTGAQISLGGLRTGTGNAGLQWSGGFGFSGFINRVRVHGGQLDAAQVAQNFAAGPAQPTPNAEPTDITLSATSIAENNAANATVGTLSATDPDAGNTFTYSLTSGVGSTDNASFTIVGNALKLTPSADYETKNSYAIRIRATDQGSLFTEKAFTISITDGPETPLQIWRAANFAGVFTDTGNAANSADPDFDGLSNLLEFSFGTAPNNPSSGPGEIEYANGSLTKRGLPLRSIANTATGVNYRCNYTRRKDHLTAGITYSVQFSADMSSWTNGTGAETVVASDADLDVVSMKHPFFLPDGRKAKFFRVQVTTP